MLDTLERFQIPYSMHKVIPVAGDLEPEPRPVGNKVICMGSYAMRRAARKHGWNPGVFDLEPFDFETQLEHWGDALLNADSIVAPFADIRFTGERFVRPADDTKPFTGAVFTSEEFRQWQHRIVVLEENLGTSLTGRTMVQVSSPKAIQQEVRCWIVEGRVITSSIYRIGQRVHYSDRVDRRFIAFAEKLAQHWSPLKAYCLDVCETLEGLKVVEINTINSAGFYAADMQKLVLALDDLTT